MFRLDDDVYKVSSILVVHLGVRMVQIECTCWVCTSDAWQDHGHPLKIKRQMFYDDS